MDSAAGGRRADAPTLAGNGADGRVSGELAWVPDASGADLLVGVALRDGRPVGVAIDKKGALLVADDVGNTVWRVTPGSPSTAMK